MQKKTSFLFPQCILCQKKMWGFFFGITFLLYWGFLENVILLYYRFFYLDTIIIIFFQVVVNLFFKNSTKQKKKQQILQQSDDDNDDDKNKLKIQSNSKFIKQYIFIIYFRRLVHVLLVQQLQHIETVESLRFRFCLFFTVFFSDTVVLK
eukprot:TRINITY_DN6702_c0_g1_i3.p1 TRINITY_DN6702_c0_g1~~TRINITY_DN6702_c0_g1_i3.p1  ORF type:complete len:150 (-),score=2.45 TRINITY_DN6702_c0_g1_i3:161-610(-)